MNLKKALIDGHVHAVFLGMLRRVFVPSAL